MRRREGRKLAPIHTRHEWSPHVKNWFAKGIYENKMSPKVIDPNKTPDDWVLFGKKATIEMQIEAKIQPQDRNYQHLNLHVKASFVPAFSSNTNGNRQFLSPYQDQVRVAILYDSDQKISRIPPTQTAILGPAESNGCSGHKHTSKNKVGAGASATILGNPVAGNINFDMGEKSVSFKKADFDLQTEEPDKQTTNGIKYKASQIQCYSYKEGKPIHYEVASPDRHMHEYFGFPDDSLNKPSKLATEICFIDTHEKFKLTTQLAKRNERNEYIIRIRMRQRLVCMSIWRCCANYWFINDATLGLLYKLVTNSAGQVTGHQCETEYFRRETSYRKNESWRGINYKLGSLESDIMLVYDLYLMSEFDIEQCREIKGNVVILTNKNTVYFIIKDKIVMKDEKPYTVSGINRQEIELSNDIKPKKYTVSGQEDDIKPKKYTVSRQKKEKIIIEEATLKRGYTLMLDPNTNTPVVTPLPPDEAKSLILQLSSPAKKATEDYEEYHRTKICSSFGRKRAKLFNQAMNECFNEMNVIGVLDLIISFLGNEKGSLHEDSHSLKTYMLKAISESEELKSLTKVKPLKMSQNLSKKNKNKDMNKELVRFFKEKDKQIRAAASQSQASYLAPSS